MASGTEPGNRFPCAVPDCHAPRFTCQAVAYWRRLIGARLNVPSDSCPASCSPKAGSGAGPIRVYSCDSWAKAVLSALERASAGVRIRSFYPLSSISYSHTPTPTYSHTGSSPSSILYQLPTHAVPKQSHSSGTHGSLVRSLSFHLSKRMLRCRPRNSPMPPRQNRAAPSPRPGYSLLMSDVLQKA